MSHIAHAFKGVCPRGNLKNMEVSGMLKKSTLNNYLLSAARTAYVVATVAAVLAALALLNVGGH